MSDEEQLNGIHYLTCWITDRTDESVLFPRDFEDVLERFFNGDLIRLDTNDPNRVRIRTFHNVKKS